MGSLTEKLEYLQETLETLEGSGYDWLLRAVDKEEMTLRERVDLIYELLKPYIYLSGDPWVGNNITETITLADGTETTLNRQRGLYYTTPPLYLRYDTIITPFIPRRANAQSNSESYFDFSKTTLADGCKLTVEIMNVGKCRSIIFNDQQSLPAATLSNQARDRGGLFTNGIKFGKKVFDCNTNWIQGTLYGNWPAEGVFVSVPEGFEGTLYLSKILIKTECLVSIVNNLADMSGTDTVYTLNLGTDNLAKLTEEQIAIATAKGWEVT